MQSPDATPWPEESCPKEAPNLPDDAQRFIACSTGSGSFGRWTLDGLGLPGYDYLLDEQADARASFPNTADVDRRDHWHAFGNDRVNAIFVNDGYVQVLTQDRGPTWLNHFDAEAQNYAGGFSYLDDGEATWSTAYRYRPANAQVTRRFGLGYAESATTYRGVTLMRRVHAPPGDFPGVIDEVTLVNTSDDKKTLRHYEYWDVGRQQLRGNWLASGVLDSNIPERLSEARLALNQNFDEAARWDPAQHRLSVKRSVNPLGVAQLPAADAISDLDVQPGDPFLQALIGPISGMYTDQSHFFGQGGVAAPDAVAQRLSGEVATVRSGDGQPLALILRSDVELMPKSQQTLRFVYGYTPMGGDEPQPPIDSAWQDGSRALWEEAQANLRNQLFYFATPTAPFLQRELAWHSAQLLQSIGYREYWGRHIVPQGSAYLYLHGVDGAPRDQFLFTLPLCYLRPAMAREVLQLTMGLIHRADRRMSYSFHGHGVLDDAYIHTAPSDLYLFFLLAMSEYLAATGDTSILDEPVAAHPRDGGPAEPGFVHVQNGLRHLFDTIGTGPHGLLRVQTGDWSDGIVLAAKDRELALKLGESVPNTQMAAWVLPLAASWVRPRDPSLADEMLRRASDLRSATAAQFSGDHYLRAYFGDGIPYGADFISLESQVWPLIAGIPTATESQQLVASIQTQLEAHSPIGAFIATPPGGDPNNGQVWPAITGLLTWGYARGRAAGATLDAEDRAFGSLQRMTLYAHAEAFPNMWSGIWSGPDGSYVSGGDAPGAAWKSEVTPMIDYPVQNNNLHAMALLAALRTLGIEPLIDGSGLRITPPLPRDELHRFRLSTPLLQLAADTSSLHVTYHPVASGQRSIEIALDRPIKSATQNGATVAISAGDTSVRFTFPTDARTAIELAVTF